MKSLIIQNLFLVTDSCSFWIFSTCKKRLYSLASNFTFPDNSNFTKWQVTKYSFQLNWIHWIHMKWLFFRHSFESTVLLYNNNSAFFTIRICLYCQPFWCNYSQYLSILAKHNCSIDFFFAISLPFSLCTKTINTKSISFQTIIDRLIFVEFRINPTNVSTSK